MTEKRGLTIVQINDTHSYLDAHQELFWEGGELSHRVVGGYAKISGLLKTVREECGRESVIALDNGDTLPICALHWGAMSCPRRSGACASMKARN